MTGQSVATASAGGKDGVANRIEAEERAAAHGGPGRLRADKAHRSTEHLRRLRESRTVPRIARAGVESGERPGRHRWKIERSISWLFGCRRPTVRYERKGSHFPAFPGLAAALTCHKKLAQPAT